MDQQLLEAWLEADVELGRSLVHVWLEDSWKDAIGTPAGADQDISTLVRKMQVSTLADLADWCLQNVDVKSDCAKAFDRSREELIDCLGFELAVVADRFTYESASAYMEEKEDALDPSMEAKKLAQELTLGWPEVSHEPVFVRASNRFVCSFPLEYPMGLADPNADRKFKVPSLEYNQHMIRHSSGSFVNGSRGHRVLWALVNSQLLEEARSKCCGVYRVALKKVGGRVLGLAHITKGQLQNMLHDEQQSRMLGHLLMSIGRDVRSTPMAWAYEGKKLDAAVKHLAWRPPWMEAPEGESEVVEGKQKPLSSNERKKLIGEGKILVDRMGLGRQGALWWTLNPKYYMVHDIHRFASTTATDTLLTSTSRNLFLRDHPDIASYMFALRAELTMRIVMPATVDHSANAPFLSMARF